MTTNQMTNPVAVIHQNTVWLMQAEYLQAFCNQIFALPAAAEPLAVSIAAPTITKVQDTAVIRVRGTLLKSVPALYRLRGLNVTGYDDIVRQLNEAVSDAGVKKITLSIESPGGQVAGVQEAADAISAANAVKPVLALVDDLCCSGAYYLASQAGRIESNRNAMIGSIGVFSLFYDYSKWADNEGIRAVVIASGEHKGMGVPGSKITDEQIAAYKEVVDGMADHFKAAVKTGRQMTDEQIQSVSTGRIWLAPQAKAIGLIDKITSQTKYKTGVKTMSDKNTTPAAGDGTVETPAAPNKQTATLSELKAAFPGHLPFAVEQFEAGASMLEAKAAFGELLAVENKLLQTRAVEAEKKAANASIKDGVPAINSSGEGGGVSGDFISLAKERADSRKITLRAAMSEIASEQPEVYQTHLAACQKVRAPLRDKD